MKICIGDKVMLIHGNGTGVVKEIDPRGFCIVEMDGFDRRYPMDALLRQDDGIYEELSQSKAVVKDKGEMQKEPIRKHKAVHEIDLHFDRLVPDPKTYRHDEILDYQLRVFKRWLSSTIRSGQKQGMVITGKGQGILRDHVIKLLDDAPVSIEWHLVNEGQLGFTIA